MPMKILSKTSAIQATTVIILLLISSLFGESPPPTPQPSQLSFSKLLYKQCNANTNPNSESLVNSLKSAPLSGFKISIQGNGSGVLYGILECRGDLNQKECARCTSMVTSQLETQCKNSSSAWIQLEGCYLRYGRHPFFWKQHDFYELYHQCGQGEDGLLGPDFNEVLEEVVYSAPIHDGFAAAGAKSRGPTYALAHCNAYLSPYDCGVCLRVAMYFVEFDCVSPDYMPYIEDAGGQILLDSCLLRFDNYKFFDQEEKGAWWNTKFPSAPRRKIHKLAVAIGCGVVGGAVFALCFLGICIKIKARKRLTKVHCIVVDGQVPRLSNESTNVAVATPRVSNS